MELKLVTEAIFCGWILLVLFISPFRVVRRKREQSFSEKAFFLLVSAVLLILIFAQVVDNPDATILQLMLIIFIFATAIALLAVILDNRAFAKEKADWKNKRISEFESKSMSQIEEYFNNFFKIL